MPRTVRTHEMNTITAAQVKKVFCSECEFSTELGDKSEDDVLTEHEAYRERIASNISGKVWAQKFIVEGPAFQGNMTLPARTDLASAFNNGAVAALQEAKYNVGVSYNHLDGFDEISWERI